MKFIDIREHIKYLKYGYGRATDQLNIAIRNGRIKRDEALDIVKEIDGNYDIENKDTFCKYLDITTTKFDQIVDSFVNTEIFEKTSEGWKFKFERK